MKKKIVQLCVAVCLAMTTTVTAYAVPTNQDLQNSQNSVAAAEAKYNEAKAKADSLQQKVEEMNMVMSDLVIKQEEIKGNIESTTAQIDEKQKEVDKKQEEYNERIVATYKSPAPSLVEVLFTSENLGDMISKLEGLKTISEYEKEMLTELQTQKQELDAKMKELEALKVEQQAKIDEQKVKQAEAETLNNEAKNELAKVNQILKDEKDKLGNIQAQIDAVNAANEEARIAAQTSNGGGNFNGGQITPPARGSDETLANYIVTVAKQYIGVPYEYGASGPNSFDCSGFTSYVYRKAAGLSITRTTYTQVNQGYAVSRDALQPGDLVFFGSSASSPTHVGIYVGGNMYIHAPQTNDHVKISDLGARKNFVAARRIV